MGEDPDRGRVYLLPTELAEFGVARSDLEARPLLPRSRRPWQPAARVPRVGADLDQVSPTCTRPPSPARGGAGSLLRDRRRRGGPGPDLRPGAPACRSRNGCRCATAWRQARVARRRFGSSSVGQVGDALTAIGRPGMGGAVQAATTPEDPQHESENHQGEPDSRSSFDRCEGEFAHLR